MNSDFSLQKLEKKLQERIRQEVFDKWRFWSRSEPKACSSFPSSLTQAPTAAVAAARNPVTGAFDSGGLADSDSATRETSVPLSPFDEDLGEKGLGWDDLG